MIKKILPLILLLIGTGAGVGAGVFLRPVPAPMAEEDAAAAAEHEAADHAKEAEGAEETDGRAYVKMNNQFVVPVVDRESVRALVIVSLNLEVLEGSKDAVLLREPKLRDSFLQVLFDHANLGGFEGEFTSAANMDVLRAALLEIGTKVMGDVITDVLIADIGRQDY